ncbi:class I SAM-dependent methyltransferase [Propionibacterium sp.]|uniref:class I SAM-dependent methyltransferase n=1 Tax=Propionibacterium sp. TaxID=1977903 RepID=UPI0039E97DF9
MSDPHPFAQRWNHNTHYYPRIAELVEGRHLVLDVGCGEGTLARYLATGDTGVAQGAAGGGSSSGAPGTGPSDDQEIPSRDGGAGAAQNLAPVETDSPLDVHDATQPVQGTGHDRAAAAPGGSTFRHEVIGLDMDASVLPKDSPGTHFVLADGQQIPYPAGCIDAVVCVAALHHMNARLALTEMHRVLRPGGRIVILGLAHWDWRPQDVAADLRDLVVNTWMRTRMKRWEPDTLKEPAELNWSTTRATVQAALPGASFQRVRMWRWLAVWDDPATPGAALS